jgi:hypothetical protein
VQRHQATEKVNFMSSNINETGAGTAARPRRWQTIPNGIPLPPVGEPDRWYRTRAAAQNFHHSNLFLAGNES